MSKEQQELAEVKPTYSQRFTAMVVKEFGQEIGTLALNPYQQRLAQHMFIGIDTALKNLDADRIKKGMTNKTPIVWGNINMNKLAIDVVHRIDLGLDALIKNHIHPVPYFNSKLKKYDLDLQIGYVGKDYYKRKMALHQPKDIIYELVRKSDTFVPKMKSSTNPVESYAFDIPEPFNRGPVIGGFGYIIYEDDTMNKLILVDDEQFKKSEKAAKTDMFWKPHPSEMKMVVIVRRVTDYLKVDPEKINASYAVVEFDANERLIEEHANQGELVDISTGEIIDLESGEETEPPNPKATSTWDPLTSPIQQRYPADKVAILKAECEKRNINISGFVPRQVHDVLLKAIKETEEMQEGTTQESNSKVYLYCPQHEDRRAIEICETDKCGKFATCDIAQNAINEAMKKAGTQTETEDGSVAGKPEF